MLRCKTQRVLGVKGVCGLTAAPCYPPGIPKAEVSWDLQLSALKPFLLPSRVMTLPARAQDPFESKKKSRSSRSLLFDHASHWHEHAITAGTTTFMKEMEAAIFPFQVLPAHLPGVGRVISLRHIFPWHSNTKWECAGSQGHCLPSGKSSLNTKTCLRGIWNRVSKHLRRQAWF